MEAFLKFASLCSYIYRTKKSNSATLYTPCLILYNRQVTDRMGLTLTAFFLLYCCLTFNRRRCLCLYCNITGDSFSIALSSLIGPMPCRWVRDEKAEEWEDPKSFFRVLKLASPTRCELLHAWNICECAGLCRSSTTSVILYILVISRMKQKSRSGKLRENIPLWSISVCNLYFALIHNYVECQDHRRTLLLPHSLFKETS